MIGEPKINYSEGTETIKNIGNRNVLCIIAPFKDSSFAFKAYPTIEQAVEDQKTEITEALGYKYLQLLQKHFPTLKDIVLVNITTGTTTPDYALTNEKLSNAFEELEKTEVSIINIPYLLTSDQLEMYKTFRDEQFQNMFGFGLIYPTDPETSSLTAVFNQFKTGGIYAIATTPQEIESEEYSIIDMSVYFAGLVASVDENRSLTHYVLDGVVGETTKEKYGTSIYEAILNNGALATGYRDKVNNILQIVNSGTCTWNEKINDTNDLKIDRVHHLIMNEIRRAIFNIIGKDNNRIASEDFNMAVSNIKEKYLKAGFITDLKTSISKTSSPKVEILMNDKQDNILTIVDVLGNIDIIN
ncbi:hypothetical protein MARBORIA2_14920 [Methanobrevibacter arboriphilus]|jgi:hypothetical protein|uniref:Uncharacterized protein n=1 Tax=Methanobrevibacter arboriphilus TaxID=39441 RepID=A0ACA8R1W1_METAZ|nr:hypothetical protein [Methanobrevibacter arboriphilus]BBL61506.1 hypothetical protein MarbSA_05460 [Methanobrevibacter arboriphilus]GLI12402.1 hypothetical protein MARBORIA2_14920 [Methanobrevibacter arboriphilus]